MDTDPKSSHVIQTYTIKHDKKLHPSIWFLGHFWVIYTVCHPRHHLKNHLKPWNHETMKPCGQGWSEAWSIFDQGCVNPGLTWKKNFPWRPKKWLPSGYLTVCHGIDGPNRNRWFTVLSSMVLIFHGELLNNQMVHPIHTTRASISLLFSHVWKTFMFFLATPHSSKIVGVVGLIWVVILWGNIA